MRHRPATPAASPLLGLLLMLAASLPAEARAVDHTGFDRLLRSYVKAGRVDYDGIQRAAGPALKAYVDAIGRAELKGLSRNARLAFYLNAYNALVIQAVVQRRPRLRSVMEIDGFFKRAERRLAGRTVTLDAIENAIIRPTFKDPRVHFALVCGARSCPPLAARAFTAANLDPMLDRLTRRFVNSPGGVRLGPAGVRVSKLFQWYADDFRAAAGSVGGFLAKYHATAATRLREAKRFDYLDYDWSLNGK